MRRRTPHSTACRQRRNGSTLRRAGYRPEIFIGPTWTRSLGTGAIAAEPLIRSENCERTISGCMTCWGMRSSTRGTELGNYPGRDRHGSARPLRRVRYGSLAAMALGLITDYRSDR